MFKKGILILSIIVLLISLTCVNASDNDLENDLNNSSFNTLNHQIKSSSGLLNLTSDYSYDEITDSNFTRGIIIEKPITINGNGHRIDARGQTRVFNITSDNVTLKNITFINGGEIDNGAAIYSKKENLNIIDCSFINNTALVSGGAVFIDGYSYKNKIINCNFNKNTAFESGGAFKSTFAEITFDNVTFNENMAKEGGCIRLEYSLALFKNCIFENNEAVKSAGALYSFYSMTNIENCEITDNSVNGEYIFGGGIVFYGFENNITDTVIKNNSLSGRYGYGSSIFNYGKLNIKNSQITDNKQKTKNYIKETIYIPNGKVNFVNSSLENNIIESENESIIYSMFWILVYDKIFDENVTIPSFLDLRTTTKENGTVEDQFKPIQNQGDSGGCWAFSATSIIEYYFKSHYDLKYEFSENNLINIMGPYAKDGWTTLRGGGTAKSAAYWTRWSGPVNASDDPFNESSKTSPDNLTVMGHVQDIIYITCGDITQFKLAVLNYGPVVIGYKYFDPEVTCINGTYIESGASPINLLPRFSTHLVSIVGWDDNYPGFKFGKNIPDGAFLIRNSFGNSSFDKKLNKTLYYEDNGYNWISYYDKTLSTESNAYALVNVEGTDNYNHNYQYDTKGTLISMGYDSDTAWFANQFKATDNSPLAAFSTYTFTCNSTYEAFIYINDKLSYTQNGTISNPGYNTIKLNKLVNLNKGDLFKISLKLTCPGIKYPIPLETADTTMNKKTTAYINQSFVSPDGINWHDISQTSEILHMELGDISYKKMNDTNVCLKAFTVKLNTTIGANTITTVYNGGKYLSATLKDSKNRAISNKKVTVTLNGKTKTLTTDSKGQIKLSADNLKPKTYTATITFKGDASYAKSTKKAKITVKKATPKLTAKTKTFKQKIKSKKYTITLKTNKNKGLGKVKVYIIFKGKKHYTKTNYKGQATFKIGTNKKGTYKAIIKFYGNSCYKEVSKSVKIKISN